MLSLVAVDAGQFPLGDGDVLDQGLFHVVLGHPGGGEAREVLVEFGLVFAGDDHGFGAQAVDEGIEANAVLGLLTLGAGRFLRIAPIGAYLLDCSHSYLFCRAMPIGKRLWPPMNADKRR
jgi:hypothetical protein